MCAALSSIVYVVNEKTAAINVFNLLKFVIYLFSEAIISGRSSRG